MPLVAFAALAVPQLGAAEIRDRGGIFTAEAVKKAEAVLDRIERRAHIPGVIETIEAIPGLGRDSSASEKRTAVERLAEQQAREIGYEGVYLLISKNDHVFSPVLVQKRFDSLLPREKLTDLHLSSAGARLPDNLLLPPQEARERHGGSPVEEQKVITVARQEKPTQPRRPAQRQECEQGRAALAGGQCGVDPAP